MSTARSKAGVSIRPHVRDGVPTGKWHIDVSPLITGSGKRERALVATHEMAVAKVRELIGERRARGIVELTGGREQVVHFQFIVEGWLADQKRRVAASKKKARSLENNIYHLVRLSEFFKDTPLSRLTRAKLDDYQAHRLNQKVQAETVNTELATLIQIQRWAVEVGHLKTVVTTDAVPVRRKMPDILTYDEYQIILAKVPERLRPMVRLLAETGCRWGEAANLRWEDVDLERGEVRITARDDWSPKTAHSARTIYLSPSLVEELAERRTSRASLSEYVFPGRDGIKPVTTAKRAFKAAVEKANIKHGGRTLHITIKTLRKCFATWAAESGMRERTLQELMGHVPGSKVTQRHYEQVRANVARAELSSVWSSMDVSTKP